MGMFSGVGKAEKPRGSGVYIKDGSYIVRIDKVKAFQNRKEEKRFGVEMTILKVLNAGGMGDPVGHKAGEQVSWVLKPSYDQFLTHVRGLVECAFGCDFDQMSDEDAEAACVAVCAEEGDAPQPLAGSVCRLVNQMITTQAGNPFVVVNWAEEIDPRTLKDLLGESGIAKLYPKDQLAELEALCADRDEEDKLDAEEA